jgi:Lrp/AsnC family leucine-responsive transcriptional regulator
MHPIELDEIDVQILAQLQEDAGVSGARLSARIGLSEASCARRIHALEKAGVIRKYTTLLDASLTEPSVTVFVYVRFDWHGKDRLEMFEQTIMEQPEVLECYLLTGEAEYLLRIAVPDVMAYVRLLADCLRRLPGLARLKSSFVLRDVKYCTELSLLMSTRHERHAPRQRRHRG